MYSDRLMSIFRGATHAGEAAGETHRGVGGVRGAGPFVMLSLRVEDDVVREARFQTYGCPTAIACSEIVCSLIEGKPLALLREITPRVVSMCVGGVAEGKEHCPELAVQALGALEQMIDG